MEGVIVSDIKIRVPTLEEIQLRAYENYLERGGEDGNALDDWLAAEKELSVSNQMDPHESTVSNVRFLGKRAAGF
jgi:hypothetical protein